ncbi:MAG: transglycosylase SLT domain-containing protein [Gemmatimonadota bacterium]
MKRYLIAAAFLGIALLTASLLRSDSAQQRADFPTYLHIQRDTGNRSEGVALIKRAIELHDAQQYTEAAATYDRAAAKLPQLADWLAVFAAASTSHAGDTAAVARRLSAVDDDLAGWAWRSPIRAFAKADARDRALDLARRAAASESAGRRAAGWSYVIELGAELSPRDRVAAGRAFINAGETGRGIRQLESAYESGTLPFELRADLRYELGRAYFAIGNYKKARSNLARVPSGHEHGADARLLIARAHYRDGDEADGKRAFRAVAAQYPQSRAATRALFFLADLPHDDGAIGEAEKYFARASGAPVKTSESSLAAMRLGGIAFVQEEYAAARRIFEKYRKQHPRGMYYDQATYWSAQSALRTGDTSAAHQLLRALRAKSPVSYYGMLAREDAGVALLSGDIAAGPRTDSATIAEVERALERWDLLREVDWNEAAAHELGRVRKHFNAKPAALYQLAESLTARGAPHVGIAIGRELLNAGSGWDLRLLGIMYPRPYWDLLVSEARAQNLAPFFVAALIRQESRFNARAVSGAGAVGLMQVMPATGRQLRKQAGVGPVTRDALTEPAFNLKLGTSFLADLLSMYGQRVDAALVAYNAGPSRADRWRRFPEFSNENLFVERIPFDETRDYVKVVKLNAAIYRALYPAARAGD